LLCGFCSEKGHAMNTIPVKKELISWARRRAGLEIKDLTEAFPKFAEWEKGGAVPTLRQLEHLAKKLVTPLGFFFLQEPPVEQLPIQDFRSVSDAPISHPSPDLLDTIFMMQRRQAWYREFIIQEGGQPLSFVGSASISENPADVAEQMRLTLGISSGWAKNEASWEEALKALWLKVEQAGILVVCNGVVGNNTTRILDVKEFRGFVLADAYAPLIFINNVDAKAAQLFTLAHELAHIWIGSEGVVNLPNMNPAENKTETFCNSTAAEFLVPTVEFESEWNRDQSFYRLANHFKVSPLVIARRALDTRKIGREEFFSFYGDTISRVRTDKTKKKGGNFYATSDYRIGHPFASAIARAVKSGRMLYHEAYNLTGLQGATFDKYIFRIERQGG
jgi:Zn-dependent peptidase ImmA (M78 family)